jgi:hypothetical protein
LQQAGPLFLYAPVVGRGRVTLQDDGERGLADSSR